LFELDVHGRSEVSPGFGDRDVDSKLIVRNVLLASPVAGLGLLCLSFRSRFRNPKPGANFMTLYSRVNCYVFISTCSYDYAVPDTIGMNTIQATLRIHMSV
jgi:hypothetical protein